MGAARTVEGKTSAETKPSSPLAAAVSTAASAPDGRPVIIITVVVVAEVVVQVHVAPAVIIRSGMKSAGASDDAAGAAEGEGEPSGVVTAAAAAAAVAAGRTAAAEIARGALVSVPGDDYRRRFLGGVVQPSQGTEKPGRGRGGFGGRVVNLVHGTRIDECAVAMKKGNADFHDQIYWYTS